MKSIFAGRCFLARRNQARGVKTPLFFIWRAHWLQYLEFWACFSLLPFHAAPRFE
jgi:hypothetical protein